MSIKFFNKGVIMKKKFHLSKRGKLYLANGIALGIFLLMMLLDWISSSAMHPGATWRIYLILQCIFTFCSLIIYYLSIIADALCGKGAKKDGENGNKE